MRSAPQLLQKCDTHTDRQTDRQTAFEFRFLETPVSNWGILLSACVESATPAYPQLFFFRRKERVISLFRGKGRKCHSYIGGSQTTKRKP